MNWALIAKIGVAVLSSVDFQKILGIGGKKRDEIDYNYLYGLKSNVRYLKYNMGDYLWVVQNYGVELADKCLNCTRNDIENKSLKFFICSTL